MRNLPLAFCCSALLHAQEPDLLPSMKQLSAATHALTAAIDAGDRAARRVELEALDRTIAAWHKAPPALEPRAEVETVLADLSAAIADLRQPGPDAAATDRWDLARLRGACTRCHLQWRSGNDDRGLFPNRGNAAFGTLRLEQQDGVQRDDRSGLVVFVEGPGLVSPALPRKPVVSQKGRSFQPPVLVVTAGTTVRFPNDDLVFHNVFSLSRSNPFDLGVYGKGIEQERTLANPGLVKLHCNIHPDMAAHVLVLENVHAAVTGPSGFWALPDLPDGDWSLRVWHPLAELQQQPLQVRGGRAVEVPLTVRENRPRVQHPNKHGRPYKKY